MKEKISQWMAGREDEFVDALAPLIAVNSVRTEAQEGMPFGPGPEEALKRALELAERWGLKTSRDGGYVGLADLNDGPDALHILAHLDIVGIGEGWDTDPFAIVRRDDLIFGRGTDDDKGPAVAAMLAMRCVKELGLPLTKNVKLVLGTDEESGSEDIEHYYASHPYAPNSVTPDSTFPVTNVEKAHYSPRFGTAWEQQPAVRGHLAELSGGIRINVAPANAKAVISGLKADEIRPVLAAAEAETGVNFTAADTEQGAEITAVGLQSHAAHPDGGKNAITAMLQVLCELPLAQEPQADAVRKLHELFPYGDHRGQALGIAMEDEISGPLTLTLSLLELNETGFWAMFDSRASLCSCKENTQDIVTRKMNNLGWTCEGDWRPGHHVDANSAFIQTLLETYEEFSGKKGYCESIGGGTYVHEIPGGVAFGAGDRDFDSHLHGANERASLKQLLLTAEIYAAVIARLCK